MSTEEDIVGESRVNSNLPPFDPNFEDVTQNSSLEDSSNGSSTNELESDNNSGSELTSANYKDDSEYDSEDDSEDDLNRPVRIPGKKNEKEGQTKEINQAVVGDQGLVVEEDNQTLEKEETGEEETKPEIVTIGQTDIQDGLAAAIQNGDIQGVQKIEVLEDIKLKVTNKPESSLGGKSKKKKMKSKKSKNKSNKKMKKKQTKKGGKQMKKRSLKRKIKK